MRAKPAGSTAGLRRSVGDARIRRSIAPAATSMRSPRRGAPSMLEPDNWRHHLRLASVSWGEERLREAVGRWRCCPAFRSRTGWPPRCTSRGRRSTRPSASSMPASPPGRGRAARRASAASRLHWLRGLDLSGARRRTRGRSSDFERELSFEASGHLYARECCANTWYAIGALPRPQAAADSGRGRVSAGAESRPEHPLARLGLGILNPGPPMHAAAAVSAPSFDAALAQAAAWPWLEICRTPCAWSITARAATW